MARVRAGLRGDAGIDLSRTNAAEPCPTDDHEREPKPVLAGNVPCRNERKQH